MRCIKSNLGPYPGPIGVSFKDDQMVFTDAPVIPTKKTKIDIAVEFLNGYLTEVPKPESEVEAAGKALGISRGSLYSARTKLWGDPNKAAWSLPPAINDGEEDIKEGNPTYKNGNSGNQEFPDSQFPIFPFPGGI